MNARIRRAVRACGRFPNEQRAECAEGDDQHERMDRDELVTEHLATHVLPLDEGPTGYKLFKEKQDDRVRSVFTP